MFVCIRVFALYSTTTILTSGDSPSDGIVDTLNKTDYHSVKRIPKSLNFM